MQNPFELINEKLNKIEKMLSDLTLRPNACSKNEDTVLNAQEAASFLNLKISTIYSLVDRSEFPVSKRGNRLYFFKQDLISTLAFS